MRKHTPRLAAFVVVLLTMHFMAGMASAEDRAGAASKLTLVGIAEQNGVVYASLFDYASGYHFLPSTKAPDGGYELVAITADQNAIIRHNGQSFLLRMGWSDSATLVANAPAQANVPVPNIPRPGSDESATPTPPTGAKLPLVFQSDQVKGMNFTDEQKAIISRLRGQFLAAVGATANSAAVASTPVAATAATPSTATEATSSAATSSPGAPAQTWISAQEYNDEIFRMLFGYQAFNAYEERLGSKP